MLSDRNIYINGQNLFFDFVEIYTIIPQYIITVKRNTNIYLLLLVKNNNKLYNYTRILCNNGKNKSRFQVEIGLAQL